MTRIGSLCSGYGGLDMAVQSVIGGTVAWHAEYDDAPSKILAHHWPDVPNLGDIHRVGLPYSDEEWAEMVKAKDFHGDDYQLPDPNWSAVEPVDVLTAGYPCQPFSHAGQRQGENDARHLWPHIGQAVRVLRPRLVVLENVAGHLSLGFGRVLGDLAALGYDARWVRLRAADVGAPHGRARVFVAAYPANDGRERRGPARAGRPGPARCGLTSPDSLAGELQRRGVAGVLAEAPRGTEIPRGERQRDGHTAGDRRTAAPDTSSAERRGSEPADLAPTGRTATEPGERASEAAWGGYAPAIHRWERTLGRAAPAPTERGRTGAPRLSPAFVEWLMGLPAGHVTAVPDITRNAQLRILGNGVVPQQAAAAVSWLLRDQDVAA